MKRLQVANLVAVFSHLDRGDFLEASLDQFLLGAGDRKSSILLKQIWITKGSKSTVILPAWVANATVFQNGAIIPLTPDVLESYGVSSYIHSRESVEVGGTHLEDYGEMPVAVVMKASASFPGLLPATTFGISNRDDKNPYLHLMDGGLADNLGALSAVSLMKQFSSDDTSSLILIDAFNGETEPFSRRNGSPRFYQSFGRSASISLDSWHTRYLIVLERLIPEQPVVHLGFSSIRTKGLRERIARIGTGLNISGEEQRDLFKAADEVVTANRSDLCAAVFKTPV